MIKHLALAGILGATALTATAATAEDNSTYVQLNTGGSFALAPKGDMGRKGSKVSGLYGLEVGHKFDDHFRAGVGVDYRAGYVSRDSHVKYTEDGVFMNDDKQKWSTKSLAVMANLYYDITEVHGFTPYVTIGAGVAKNNTKETVYAKQLGAPLEKYTSKGKSINFAYKVGLGSQYAISENISLDLRYQFVNLGKLRADATENDPNVTKGKLKGHEAMIGISYNF